MVWKQLARDGYTNIVAGEIIRSDEVTAVIYFDKVGKFLAVTVNMNNHFNILRTIQFKLTGVGPHVLNYQLRD